MQINKCMKTSELIKLIFLYITSFLCKGRENVNSVFVYLRLTQMLLQLGPVLSNEGPGRRVIE